MARLLPGLPVLSQPYQRVVLIERYRCLDSILVVYTTETGEWWYCLTPYN